MYGAYCSFYTGYCQIAILSLPSLQINTEIKFFCLQCFNYAKCGARMWYNVCV